MVSKNVTTGDGSFEESTSRTQCDLYEAGLESLPNVSAAFAIFSWIKLQCNIIKGFFDDKIGF